MRVADCPEHIFTELTVNVGNALTVTVAVLKPVQLPFEPVIVYTVDEDGETFKVFVFAPVSHV